MRGEAVQERARRVLANPTGVAAPGLIRLKPGDESAALFLFPGAGADVLELDPLGPTPGELASRDVSVDAIVDRALEAITQAQPRGACHLLGYSFGGAIAVEAARRLGVCTRRGARSRSSCSSRRSTIPVTGPSASGRRPGGSGR